MNRTQAQYLAQAALERIYQEKLKDTDMEHDALKESWSNKLNSGKQPEFKDFALGNGSFEVKYDYYEAKDKKQTLYGLQDEQSKYNINEIRKDVENRSAEYKRLLKNVLDTSVTSNTDVLADTFIDWIDSDEVSRSKGKEKEEYEDGIEAKNAPLDRLKELLMIDGYNSAIVEQLSNYVTVYGDGKINLNTAPKEVFLALGLSEAIAQDIFDYRNGKDGVPGTEDDDVIETENLADFLKDINISDERYSRNEKEAINATSGRFSVKSSFYRATSYGTVGPITKKITTVVEMLYNTTETKTPQLHYYYEE